MSEDELIKATHQEWNDLNTKVEGIGTRTSRWAGGLSVISFSILFGLGFAVTFLRDIADTVSENRLKLAVPQYTKADDNAVRKVDWDRHDREQEVKDKLIQNELDRRQIWIDGQDAFRLQMIQFTAETRAAIKEMKGLVEDLKRRKP